MPLHLQDADLTWQLASWAAALALGIGWMWLATYTDRRARMFAVLVDGGPGFNPLRVLVATAWLNRRCGLLNHLGLERGTGLWIKGARAVHTRGMQFVIDVVFVGKGGEVLHIESYLPPGNKSHGPAGTEAVLELAAGAAAELNLTIGTRLELT